MAACASELEAERRAWGMIRALEALALLGADFGVHHSVPEREAVMGKPSRFKVDQLS
jgi:hypothetical protein